MFTTALLKLKRLPIYPTPVQLCGQRQINLLTRSGILKRATRVRARKKNCFRICSFREAVNSFHTKKRNQEHKGSESRESNHKAILIQKKTEEFMHMITQPEVQKKVADLITVLKKQLVIPSVSKSDKAIQKKGVTKQSHKISSNKTAYQKNQVIQSFKKIYPVIDTETSDKETLNNTTMLSDYAALTTTAFASSSAHDGSDHKCSASAGRTHWRLLAEQNVNPDVPKQLEKECYVKPDPRVQYQHKPMFTRRSITASDMRTRIKNEQMKLCIEQDEEENNNISNNLNSMSHNISKSDNENVEIKETTRENSCVSLLNRPVLLKKILEEHDTIYGTGIKQDSTMLDTKQNDEDTNEQPMLVTDRTKEDNSKFKEQTREDCQVPFLNKSRLYTNESNTQVGVQEKRKTSGKLDSRSTDTRKIYKEQLKETSNKYKNNLNLQLCTKAILNSAHVKSNIKVRKPKGNNRASAEITENKHIMPATNVLSTRELPDYNSSTPKVTRSSSFSKLKLNKKAERIPLYHNPTADVGKHKIDQKPTDRSLLLTSKYQQKQMQPVQHEIKQVSKDISHLTSNYEYESKRKNYEHFVDDMKKILTQRQDATCPDKKRAHPRLLESSQTENTAPQPRFWASSQDENTDSYPRFWASSQDENTNSHPRPWASSQVEQTDIQYYGGNTMYSGNMYSGTMYNMYGTNGTSDYPDYPDEMPYYPMCQEDWTFGNISQHNVPKSVASRAKDYPITTTTTTPVTSPQEPNPLDQLWAQGFFIGQKLKPMSSGLEFNYNSPLFNIQSSTFVPQQNRQDVKLYNNVSDSQLTRYNSPFDFIDTSHMKSSYTPQSSYAPKERVSSYAPRKCLTSAQMLEYAKLNQAPQTFPTCPDFSMPPYSFPSDPMQSVTGLPGSSVMPGVPVQGMYGLTGHEMLSSPGQTPGLQTQEAVGLQGLVIPSLQGSVMPGSQEMIGSPGYALSCLPGSVIPAGQVMPCFSAQQMIGSPGYAVAGFPGLVMPASPGQDISGLPSQITLGLPTQETIDVPGHTMPGFQGSVIPGLPGQVTPGSPGQLIPGLPGPAMPGLPGQAMPGLPGQAMPGVPGRAIPGVPGKAMPGLPGYSIPGLPGPIMPGLAASAEVGLPRQVMTGFPAQEVLILPEQATYLVPGQTSPSLPVRMFSSLPDITVPTVPACAQQPVLLCPRQIVYNVPNSYPCP